MTAELDRAIALMQMQRYDDALTLLFEALGKEPNNTDAHLIIASIRLETEQLDEAREHAQTALSLEPEHWYAHQLLARIALTENRISVAETSVYECLRLDPEKAESWLLKGDLEFARNDLQGVLRACQDGLALDPEHLGILAQRGHVEYSQGRLEDLETTIATMLAIAPENEDAWRLRSAVSLLNTDPNRAKSTSLETLRINPQNRQAHLNLRRSLEAEDALVRMVLNYGRWVLESHHQFAAFIFFGIGISTVFGLVIPEIFDPPQDRLAPLPLMLFFSLVYAFVHAINTWAHFRLACRGHGKLYSLAETCDHVISGVLIMVTGAGILWAFMSQTMEPLLVSAVAFFWVHIVRQLFSRRNLAAPEPNRLILQLYYVFTGVLALAPAIPFGFTVSEIRVDSWLGFLCFLNLFAHTTLVRKLRTHDFRQK